jgi:hypothetical protein
MARFILKKAHSPADFVFEHHEHRDLFVLLHVRLRKRNELQTSSTSDIERPPLPGSAETSEGPVKGSATFRTGFYPATVGAQSPP